MDPARLARILGAANGNQVLDSEHDHLARTLAPIIGDGADFQLDELILWLHAHWFSSRHDVTSTRTVEHTLHP